LDMGNAARANKLNIQYCMPLWNDYLQSVEIQAVTQTRVSNDNTPGSKQWPIFRSSLIADSLQLYPFKDNFWSTKVQPNNKYSSSEPNPELQALVSILSTGPVGISDKINYVNKTLVLQLVNIDGLLLKPDRPATSIDATFSFNPPNGELAVSYSSIGGYNWYYVLGAEMIQEYQLKPSQLYPLLPNNQTSMRRFNWHIPKTSISDFSESKPLIIHPNDKKIQWDFSYHVIVPTLSNGFLIYGEWNKFVTMSTYRFTSIVEGSNKVDINVQGGVNEKSYCICWSCNLVFYCYGNGNDWFNTSWKNYL